MNSIITLVHSFTGALIIKSLSCSFWCYVCVYFFLIQFLGFLIHSVRIYGCKHKSTLKEVAYLRNVYFLPYFERTYKGRAREKDSFIFFLHTSITPLGEAYIMYYVWNGVAWCGTMIHRILLLSTLFKFSHLFNG